MFTTFSNLAFIILTVASCYFLILSVYQFRRWEKVSGCLLSTVRELEALRYEVESVSKYLAQRSTGELIEVELVGYDEEELVFRIHPTQPIAVRLSSSNHILGYFVSTFWLFLMASMVLSSFR